MVPRVSPLGSVGRYTRHVLLATANAVWPAHPERSNHAASELTRLLRPPNKFSLCDAASSESGVDLLVFPDSIRLRLPAAELPRLPALLSAPQLVHSSVTALPHRHAILVCTHGSVDCRCGTHGTRFHAALQSRIAQRRLDSLVGLYCVSHIGGHKYAGNIIAYPAGDWYGYLGLATGERLEQEADAVLDAVVGGGTLWQQWRGRMALTNEEQHEAYRAAMGISCDAYSTHGLHGNI